MSLRFKRGEDGESTEFLPYARDTAHSRQKRPLAGKKPSIEKNESPSNGIKCQNKTIFIKKGGFETNIGAAYGLIIKDTKSGNDVYILFSNDLDALLDEKQKQLPERLYELVLSGKGVISQRFSGRNINIYKTDREDFIYKEFGKGIYELSKVDNYDNLFKINGSYQPLKK